MVTTITLTTPVPPPAVPWVKQPPDRMVKPSSNTPLAASPTAGSSPISSLSSSSSQFGRIICNQVLDKSKVAIEVFQGCCEDLKEANRRSKDRETAEFNSSSH